MFYTWCRDEVDLPWTEIEWVGGWAYWAGGFLQMATEWLAIYYKTTQLSVEIIFQINFLQNWVHNHGVVSTNVKFLELVFLELINESIRWIMIKKIFDRVLETSVDLDSFVYQDFDKDLLFS